MNLNSTLINPKSYYYPIGSTPPVCLTQDLPPEFQNVDILLLGCGDARHVLFTCFENNTRKIDVTCCDLEPMIHARNVLLYTLLIDDKTNQSIDKIWNIYYHWKIDKKSLNLLESQSLKLRKLSESINRWHNSVYGSIIRFCDERSLSSVRSYWSGFASYGLTSTERIERLDRLQAVIDRAKASRQLYIGRFGDQVGYRSTFPIATSDEAWADLCKVSEEWWEYGMVPASTSSASESTVLNPGLLFSPNYSLTMFFSMSSLGGIPLSTAYTSINEGSAFHLESKGASVTERLVNCAKSHFTQWALAFRRAVANKIVIRIFSGDALAFCFTLRNCRLTKSTTMNLFCHNWTNCPLILNEKDYGPSEKRAPLSFDIIDTSNLMDYLGPLNLITFGSNLLKNHLFSCFYAELLVLCDANPIDRMSNLLCADVKSMSFLLGLVPPDLFTNATYSVEESRNVGIPHARQLKLLDQARSRLRWKRLRRNPTFRSAPFIQIKSNELAKFLTQVHDLMFKSDDLEIPRSSGPSDQMAWLIGLRKLFMRPYNRASFAFLLSILKNNIVTDWDKCLKKMYSKISSHDSFGLVKAYFEKDLALSLHVFRVDDSLISEPSSADMRNPIVAPIFRKCKNLPYQLCVTIRVPMDHLSGLAQAGPSATIMFSFEGRDLNGKQCLYLFSSVQIAYGKWHEEDDTHPYIEEYSAEQRSTSDMFASVMVPASMLTSMLLQSEQFVPKVKCRLTCSMLNIMSFTKILGQDLWFFCSELISNNVFITEFMPGMSKLPKFAILSAARNKIASDITEARLSPDGPKIKSLVKHIYLESEVANTLLAIKSTVDVGFKSPLTAVITIAGSLNFLLEFPIPVSPLKRTFKVVRSSSHIEVESCLYDPLVEDAPAFLFPCFLMKICGVIIPMPWTATYVNLDSMPSIDLSNPKGEYVSWLHDCMANMFSVCEVYTGKSHSGTNLRTCLKDGLSLLFTLYAGCTGGKNNYFVLKTVKIMHTLILPSCLRLDLANNTLVLDCALIPLTSATINIPFVAQLLDEIKGAKMLSCIKVGKADIIVWKALMPALVERCRTWKHLSECEYVKAGEVPLSKGLSGGRESSICSCGIGKFPEGYLKDQIERFPAFSSMLNQFGTRVAISPMFAVPYVEDCKSNVPPNRCGKCGRLERECIQADPQGFLTCSKCRKVKYCSVICQRADWAAHKFFC